MYNTRRDSRVLARRGRAVIVDAHLMALLADITAAIARGGLLKYG
jgi:hypothetical protein